MPFKNGRQHIHIIKNLRPALLLLDFGGICGHKAAHMALDACMATLVDALWWKIHDMLMSAAFFHFSLMDVIASGLACPALIGAAATPLAHNNNHGIITSVVINIIIFSMHVAWTASIATVSTAVCCSEREKPAGPDRAPQCCPSWSDDALHCDMQA
jgi:hypothetical protein